MFEGDKVTYVVTKRQGKRVRMSVKEGTFVCKGPDFAYVKNRLGKLLVVPSRAVRKKGERDFLTDTFTTNDSPFICEDLIVKEKE